MYMITMRILLALLLVVVLLSLTPSITAAKATVTVQNTPNVPASVAEPAIATDGVDYYIAYVNVSNPTYAEGNVVVVKVDSNGNIVWETRLDNDLKAITVLPLIVGKKVFLGIDKWGNRRDIYYAVLSANDGKIIKEPTPVAASDDYEEYVALAYNSKAGLVALAFFDSQQYGIYVQLFNATTLEPIGMPLGPYSTEGVGYRSITFNILPGHSTLGEGFLLVYNYYNGDQKDLAAIYIYSDGTTDTLVVPETPDTNETVGSHFTIYNPVTFRRSLCYQVFPGGNFGYDIIVPVMAYMGREESYVRLLVVDANLDTKYIDLGSGGYPSIAIGKSTIGIAYRSTDLDPAGDIKFAILSNIDSQPSITTISLSGALDTWTYAEGYSKATFNDDKNAYVVTWGIRERGKDYRIVAATVSEDGKISDKYVELYDTPGINDYPVTIVSGTTDKVVELARMMIRESAPGGSITRYDQNLTLIIATLETDIPLPTQTTSNATTGTPTIIEPTTTPTTTPPQSPTTTTPSTGTTTTTPQTTTTTTTPTTTTGGRTKTTTPSGGGGGLSTQTVVLLVIILALVIVAIALFVAMRRR